MSSVMTVIPTTLKTMNDSLSAGSEVDPHSADFVASVKHWVGQHFDQIVGELKQLVTYQSLAFEGFARTPLEDSAQAVAKLFDEVGMQQVQEIGRASGRERAETAASAAPTART